MRMRKVARTGVDLGETEGAGNREDGVEHAPLSTVSNANLVYGAFGLVVVTVFAVVVVVVNSVVAFRMPSRRTRPPLKQAPPESRGSLRC
jgi:hypothetical protein